MANRTFLLSQDEPFECQSSLLRESAIVCAASYMLPVGWLALFSSDDLTHRTIASDEGEPITYEILSCKKSDAFTRAEKQFKMVEAAIGRGRDVFDKFIQFLSEFPGEYVAVETGELWMMFEPEEFRSHLAELISAFDSEPIQTKGFLFKKSSLAPVWSLLLGQAAIPTTPSKPLEPFSIAGYSWIKKVPWL